jgi:predicted RNase H-like HicB family nuclease
VCKHLFARVFIKRDGWNISYAEELPCANIPSKTLGEAEENLHEAIDLILAVNRE